MSTWILPFRLALDEPTCSSLHLPPCSLTTKICHFPGLVWTVRWESLVNTTKWAVRQRMYNCMARAAESVVICYPSYRHFLFFLSHAVHSVSLRTVSLPLLFLKSRHPAVHKAVPADRTGFTYSELQWRHNYVCINCEGAIHKRSNWSKYCNWCLLCISWMFWTWLEMFLQRCARHVTPCRWVSGFHRFEGTRCH
jgi:hypothetical protein